MTEISIQEQNAKALARVEKQQRKAQKREQVLAFAKETLGLSKKRAKALRKLGSGYFKLDDDGLKFRGAGDKLVAVDSKQCTDFFAKKFDFLLDGNDNSQVVDPQIDPRLVAHANSADPKIAAIAKKALLAAQGKGNDTVALADKPLDKSTNPFLTLRDPRTGAIRPEQMLKVESLLRAIGTKKCAAIAQAAGLRLDGSPIPEKYR